MEAALVDGGHVLLATDGVTNRYYMVYDRMFRTVILIYVSKDGLAYRVSDPLHYFSSRCTKPAKCAKMDL